MGEKVTHTYQDAMHSFTTETVTDATDEEFSKLFRSQSEQWPKSETFIPSVEEWVTGIVKSYGFPDPRIRVASKGRFWCETIDDEWEIGVRYFRGWAFIKEQTEPLTICNEAAELYFRAMNLRHAIEKRDKEEVFARTLFFATALNRFVERRRHLKRLTIRKKSEDGLRLHNEGRDAANAERRKQATRWKEIALQMARDYRERNPDASKSEIAKWIVRKWPSETQVICPNANTIRLAL